MAEKVTPDMLKKMDIFEFVGKEELKKIAEIAEIEEFEPGEYVFRDGDIGKKIYVVLEGRVSVEIPVGSGKTVQVYTMTKWRFFGYPSLLRDKKFTTNARCLDRVKVVSIPADGLEEIFKENCTCGYLVMKRVAELIAQKLRDTRMQLISCSS
ncbi:MAG: cyclic nucleotide-binding domain-containing protein [Candidatus Hadarchaeales archaeon]